MNIKNISKALCVLLIFALAVSLVPFSAHAEERKLAVNPGPVYKRCAYYDRLMEVQRTGDQRYDVLSVAVSQIGYHEGDSDRDMDGMNLDGSKNFVEYTRVYGQVDNHEGNGVSYGYEWCAAFVSWCLRQADVPVGTAITEISCGRMTDWYKKQEKFFESASHTPAGGDIIMFQQDGKPSHVGLVLGVRDEKVYTVEGNNGGRVAMHSYALTDDYVLGYCVPEYAAVEGVDTEEILEANLNLTGRYIVTGNTVNIRKGPSNDDVVIGELTKGDTFEAEEISDGWAKIHHNGEEAWVSTGLATYEKYMVYSVKFDANGGKGGLEYQRKLLGSSFTVSTLTPTRGGYEFAGWSTEKGGSEAAYNAGDKYEADEDATLYAIWTPVVYTVTFLSDDGSVISSTECRYQDLVVAPPDPEKPSDSEFSYAFAGWDKELADVVVKDLTYTATFTATPLPPAEKDSSGARRIAIIISATALGLAAVAAAVTLVVLKKQKVKQKA